MEFRISYIGQDNSILHKGGFKDTKTAQDWISKHPEIVPLKLLVWDECINCFSTLWNFRE